MALIYQVLRVLVLGVTAAAVDDVQITWSQSPRAASLPCAVVDWSRVQPRRPPPLIDEDRSRAKPFIWRKGDDQINPKRVAFKGTLEVSRKSGGGTEGVYQCAAWDHGGQILGYPVHLKFSYMDKQFSAQPEDVAARTGQPLSIPCRISSGPAANVSWTRDGVALPQNNRYYFLDNELLITDIENEDAGIYRCIATNNNANKTRTSREGKVTVTESVNEEPSFLTVQHEDHSAVPKGDSILLLCPVLGWPRPKLIWELTPPGGRTSELEVTKEVLTLSNLDYDQEGVYTCAIEGHSDLVKTFNVSLTEPVRITLPPLPKEAMRASTVRFNCTAVGRPEPEVTWYKDGQRLTLAGRINLRTSADRKRIELVISGVTSADAGVYQCFARSGRRRASGWARLEVTGPGAAAPGSVRCAPAAAAAVALRWRAAAARVVTYTVDATLTDKHGVAITGQPHQNTEEIVRLREPLKPYIFQVRAYISSPTNKYIIPSDMSESVVCQGQGVPIKLTKLEDDKVLVSWKQFADETPGVMEWILQYRSENETHDEEHNITLAAKVVNYTLTAPPSSPLLVRLLGSRTLEWLPQNLTLVPWFSTTTAGQDNDDGVVTVLPQDLEVTEVGERWFTLKWRCEDASRYTFMVCVRRIDGYDECQESYKTTTTIEGLQPDTEYEVRVQVRIPGRARGGAFTAPYHVTTQPEGPQRFQELSYKFVNASALLVWWRGPRARYTVRHSAQLRLPVEQWAAVDADGTQALINGIEPTEQTYVMVTGYEPLAYSPILNIPAPMKELEAKDLKYAYTAAGVRVWWAGGAGGAGGAAGARAVRFAQNITQPLDDWRVLNVTEPDVELTNLDPNLPVYVMVTAAGGGRRQHVLTVPPRPPAAVGDHFYYYIGLGVACALCVCCALAAVAHRVWTRSKASQRTRRTPVTTVEGQEEEGSEMKTARVSNGGAGEPLLNGHVHITENPASKTPNGRMKKPRRAEPQAYEAFDVSRPELDATMETVLDESAYNLLDTSRRPEYDLSRSSQNLSANNSFSKLPDDNMNSELTRSTEFQLDNSKIQPTLQPNG
nr:protogenin A-like [Vanessa tameamea]